MDLKTTAAAIVKEMGGAGNVIHLTHCMTRLRFHLRDESVVDAKRLEAIEGVLGSAKVSGIYQVIIGTNVDQMYQEIQAHHLSQAKVDSLPEKKEGNVVSRALELVSATLSPLIPVIMGAGFVSILLALFTQLGWMSSESNTYVLLNGMANAVYYFFPVLIAYSLADRLKVNQVFAIASACFLLYPDFTNLFQNGEASVTFLGIPVMFASYSKQIIPIFFSVIAQKYIEKAIYRIIPQVIKTMVASGLILVLTILVTILVFGPLGALMTEGLNQLVYFVVDTCGWVAVPIMAFLNPIFLGTGLGTANFPIMLMSYVSNGYEALILPAALAGNAVQAGSGFAVAWKTRNKEFRSLAMESSITALMGITEPIIFSIHYRLKKTFITVMIGSAIAAILPGVMGVACYAMASGVLSLPAYLPGGWMNLIWACLSLVLGVVIGFVLTCFTKFDDPQEEETDAAISETPASDTIRTVNSPLSGKIIPLEEVNDASFKEKRIGEGIAIMPKEGKVYAPCDGTIISLFPTHHAIGIRSKEGVELLIHLGIDTVNLNGRYFYTHAQKGDTIKAGELLMEFDLNAIQKEGYDMTSVIIVTNTDDYLDVFSINAAEAAANERLLQIL